MAGGLANFVLETATAPGTGSFMLNGPEAGRRSFSSAFQTGQGVFYFADDGNDAEWGLGVLTIGTPSTLARTTIIGTKSGSGQALNFTGTVEVYNEIPAERMPILEEDGFLVVPPVKDFTKNYPIPAAQADGRYIIGGSGGDALRMGVIDANAKTPSFLDGAGNWHVLQSYGDYATNTALNSEVERASTIESNLQSSKVNREGDSNITGPMTANVNSDTAYAAYGFWLDTTGVRYGAAFWSGIATSSRGGVRYYYNPGVASYTTLVHTDGGAYAELRLDTLGRFHNDKGETAAWVSELPASGTTGTGRWVIIGTTRIQSFVVNNVIHQDQGTWVPFPTAFSSDGDIVVNATCAGNNDMDVFAFNANHNGFYLNIPYNSAANNLPVFVTASGVA